MAKKKLTAKDHGRKGGKVRAMRMTKAQRSESARKAANARWSEESLISKWHGFRVMAKRASLAGRHAEAELLLARANGFSEMAKRAKRKAAK